MGLGAVAQPSLNSAVANVGALSVADDLSDEAPGILSVSSETQARSTVPVDGDSIELSVGALDLSGSQLVPFSLQASDVDISSLDADLQAALEEDFVALQEDSPGDIAPATFAVTLSTLATPNLPGQIPSLPAPATGLAKARQDEARVVRALVAGAQNSQREGLADKEITITEKVFREERTPIGVIRIPAGEREVNVKLSGRLLDGARTYFDAQFADDNVKAYESAINIIGSGSRDQLIRTIGSYDQSIQQFRTDRDFPDRDGTEDQALNHAREAVANVLSVLRDGLQRTVRLIDLVSETPEPEPTPAPPSKRSAVLDLIDLTQNLQGVAGLSSDQLSSLDGAVRLIEGQVSNQDSKDFRRGVKEIREETDRLVDRPNRNPGNRLEDILDEALDLLGELPPDDEVSVSPPARVSPITFEVDESTDFAPAGIDVSA